MKKKFVAIMMVAAMAASMAACGSDGGSSDTQKGGSSTTTSDVANKDKPLVWFNRQPSNSSTGELDKSFFIDGRHRRWNPSDFCIW